MEVSEKELLRRRQRGRASNHGSHIAVSQTSFTLNNSVFSNDMGQQNISKILNKLGLVDLKEQNVEALFEDAANVFLKKQINADLELEKEAEFSSKYEEALKDKKYKTNKYIYVSEYTDMEYLEAIDATRTLNRLYKNMRISIKWISLLCQSVVETSLFESLVLMVIILNSIKMALEDPLSTTTSPTVATIEEIFLVFYISEMSIKITALGFLFNKGAYLRDPWNILDFFIVVTSLLPYVVTISFNVSALRAIRVLRPLKTITKIKALKMIVKTLFLSFSLVMNSFYILLFMIIIFAIAGTQLFAGQLKYYCMELESGICMDTVCNVMDQCVAIYGQGFVCAKTQGSPHFSIYNFDTILWSMASIFQTITLESWSMIMLNLEEGYSFVSFVFSIGIIIACEYITLNMTMAILKYKYSQVKENKIEEEEAEIDEYAPDLLKKIGTFKNVTLIHDNIYIRYKTHDRAFVGSSHFFTSEMPYRKRKKMEKRLTNQLNYNRRSRQITKPIEIEKKEVSDMKWDPKMLHFEPISFDQIELYENGTLYKRQTTGEISSVAFDAIPELPRELEKEVMKKEERDIITEERISEQPEFSVQESIEAQELEEEQESSREDNMEIPTEKLIAYYQVPPPRTKLNDVFEFNKLLTEIEQPTVVRENDSSDEELLLPDLQIDEEKAEYFYSVFEKLGPVGVSKKPKINRPKLLAKMSKRKSVMSRQSEVKNVIAKVVEEGQLDIKELQLANELSYKKLKCRIKSWKDLNEQNSYPVEDILVSMKKKMEDDAKKEIEEKTQQIKTKITYILPEITNPEWPGEEELADIKFYKRRSRPPQDMSGHLVIPNTRVSRQTIKIDSKRLETSESRLIPEEPQQRFADRLLKRVGMVASANQGLLVSETYTKEQDIMKHYFNSEKKNEKLKGNKGKKNKKKPEEPEQKMSNEDVYYQTKNDDIFQRQGEISINSSCEDILTLKRHECSLISSLNLTQKDYDIYIPSLKGIFINLHSKLLYLVETSFYDSALLLIVIFNTILMCMSGLVAVDGELWDSINYVLTTIFMLDVILKVVAYGLDFFEDPMNILDFVVSIISEVDSNMTTTNLSALRSLRVLRTLRVIRVARLIRSLSYMKIIMAVMVGVMSEFMYIFLLLSLFIFIYTLLGMEILGGTFVSQSVSGIRQNFDTFENALFSVFQVLTVENWDDIETGIILSSNNNFTIVYLISWIVLGNWILLNLMQAILLDGFDNDSITEEVSDEPAIEPQPSQPQTSTLDALNNDHLEEPKEEKSSYNDEFNRSSRNRLTTEEKESPPDNYSLFLFSTKNPFRRVVHQMVSHCAFQTVYLFLIVFSCAKLIFDTYIDQNDTEMMLISNNIEIFFSYVFILEAVLKILAFGLVIGDHSYLESRWEKLDFLIVITILIDLTVSQVNLKIIKLLRALRPLRIISKNLNMKVIISALGDSLTGLFNILIIIIMVFCMFAILGMNLLAGKLNYCNFYAPTLGYGSFGPYISEDQCTQQGGVWVTQFINFENIFSSLLSLYVFSTRENWPYYVFTFIDAETGGPVLNSNFLLFFVIAVVFIFTCSLFLMDLMIGILFMNFHAAENKIRPKLLQDCQINWINLQKIIADTDPCLKLYLQPENSLQKMFFNVVNHPYFDPVVIGIILMNIITMMCQMDDSNPSYVLTLRYLNLGFSCVFMVEMVLKLLAYDKNYFLLGWNIFDFSVVMASILDIILTYANGVSSTPALSVLPQIARIFRVLRVTKLLRLFKQFKGLQKLIETFIFMMPAFANGLALLLLYLFITSITACFLMSGITGDSSGFFSGQNNFMNFHSSLQTLFITLTGENWYVFMFESSVPGYVQCQGGGNDCTQPVNFVFWLPFIFFGQKVFMEMLGLIVLDQFDYNYIRENNPLGVFALLESDFRDNWIKVSRKHKGTKMEGKQLVELILNLRQPLGMNLGELQDKYQSQLKENDQLTPQDIQAKVYQFYMKLKHSAARHVFRINDLLNRNYLTYHETFYHLSKAAYFNQFVDQSTPLQLKMVEDQNTKVEQQLESMCDPLERDSNRNSDMNPMQKILFFQMCINAWARYTTTKIQKQQEKALEDDDSYIQSYMSIIDEAKAEPPPPIPALKKKESFFPLINIGDNTTKVPDTDIYQPSAWSKALRQPIRKKTSRPSISMVKKASSKTFGQSMGSSRRESNSREGESRWEESRRSSARRDSSSRPE